MTSPQLATSANTLLPNIVTFWGSGWTSIWGDTPEPSPHCIHWCCDQQLLGLPVLPFSWACTWHLLFLVSPEHSHLVRSSKPTTCLLHELPFLPHTPCRWTMHHCSAITRAKNLRVSVNSSLPPTSSTPNLKITPSPRCVFPHLSSLHHSSFLPYVSTPFHLDPYENFPSPSTLHQNYLKCKLGKGIPKTPLGITWT